MPLAVSCDRMALIFNNQSIMTIGIDARMYGSGFTGIGRYTYELIQNLAQLDHENEYVVFLRKEAFDEFMKEALSLETNLSRNLNHDHCETLYLYAEEETGHIITWYREGDPAATILDGQYYHLYNRIPWHRKG